MMMADCTLCNIILGSPDETKFYEDDNFIVVRTKTMKGHQERMMIIYKKHKVSIDKDFEAQAHVILTYLAQSHFTYTDEVYILDATYATIRDHWHKVMSDLGGDDIAQMQITGWLPVPIIKGLGVK